MRFARCEIGLLLVHAGFLVPPDRTTDALILDPLRVLGHCVAHEFGVLGFVQGHSVFSQRMEFCEIAKFAEAGLYPASLGPAQPAPDTGISDRRLAAPIQNSNRRAA